jgi:methionyl aminopeptidase
VGLKRANQATARLLAELAALAQPGVTTRALDNHARAYMQRIGAEPVFATEKGFPGCINTSLNDQAVHGVPGSRRLKPGDLLKIDAGLRLDGFCGDSTVTVAIGQISQQHQRLMTTTYEAMMAGIKAALPGKHIGDIGHAMQSYAESHGYGVLRDFTGHGLGRKMHESPVVPSVGRPGGGPLIPEGLVITIEPILTERSPLVTIEADGWTVRTMDGGWAAQFEHTVMVTRQGAVILSAA